MKLSGGPLEQLSNKRRKLARCKEGLVSRHACSPLSHVVLLFFFCGSDETVKGFHSCLKVCWIVACLWLEGAQQEQGKSSWRTQLLGEASFECCTWQLKLKEPTVEEVVVLGQAAAAPNPAAETLGKASNDDEPPPCFFLQDKNWVERVHLNCAEAKRCLWKWSWWMMP